MYSSNKKDFNIGSGILFQRRQENGHFKEDRKPPGSPQSVLMEFSQESTFYGFRYIARKGANFLDRFCWIAASLISAILAGIFVSSAWKTFSKSPTVVNVETTNYPLYKLSFPAVTICPANHVKKRIGEELLAKYLNLTLDKNLEDRLFHVLAGLSKFEYPYYYRSEDHFKKVHDLLPLLDNITVSDFMLRVLPRCREVFFECFWQGQYLDCCKIFTLQRTESGYCYSFNSLTSDRTKHCSIPDEFIIDEKTGKEGADLCVPRKNIASGTTTGLEVFFARRDKRDFLENGQIVPNGIRVIIHHPISPPELGKALYMPEMKSTFSVKISSSVTIASPDVKQMSVSSRKCYFPDEIQTEHFRTYTLQSCLLECRLNWLMKRCGCYPYFFVIKKEGIPECTISQLICLAKENSNIRVYAPPSQDSYLGGKRPLLNCSNCLPTCHDSVYLLAYDTFPTSHINMKHSTGHLDVYYKDFGAIKYRRESAFTLMQLIVSFGGILGLFLGISIFSVFELVYYFIRLMKAVYVKYGGETSRHEQLQIRVKSSDMNKANEFSVLPPIQGETGVFIL